MEADSEHYLTAKELAAELRSRRIVPASYETAVVLIRECPRRVGRTILLTDAVAFLREHGDTWRPHARDHQPPEDNSEGGPGLTTF